jgi:hypothetical protein
MILPLNLRPASLNSSQPSRSLSYVDFTKRSYLADYELIFNPKYLLKQSREILFLSATLQGMELMNEYSQHLEKQIQAQNDGRTIPDFDFAKALPPFFSKLKVRLIRNIFIFVTRKCYEMICVATLPLRLVDRLTKDVQKSMLRKLAKFSQMEAARRIFFTCFNSSILRAISLLTVDCGYAIYQHYTGDSSHSVTGSGPIQEKKKLRKNKAAVVVSYTPPSVSWVSVLTWTGKRALFHSLSILLFSWGYSVGAVVNPKYTPTWFATIFEALGGAILTPLLC